MKSVSPARPGILGQKSPVRLKSPPKGPLVVTLKNAGAQSNTPSMLNTAAANQSSGAALENHNTNTSEERRADETGDETPASKSSIVQRASSHGKQPLSGGSSFASVSLSNNKDKQFKMSSPRYKFDVESNKFVMVQERPPLPGQNGKVKPSRE